MIPVTDEEAMDIAMAQARTLLDRAHRTIVYSLMAVTAVGFTYLGALTYDFAVNGPRVRRPSHGARHANGELPPHTHNP